MNRLNDLQKYEFSVALWQFETAFLCFNRFFRLLNECIVPTNDVQSNVSEKRINGQFLSPT